MWIVYLHIFKILGRHNKKTTPKKEWFLYQNIVKN